MPFDNPRPKATPKPSRSKLRREEREGAAYELTDAQITRRKAEARWQAALKRAIQAGVVPDYTVNPEPVGTNRQVYADTIVSVNLFVAAPMEGLDTAGFIADLVKAGVDQRTITRLTRKHRTEAAPAHRLTTLFVNPRAKVKRGRASTG